MARTPARADDCRDAFALIASWHRCDHEATAVLLDNCDLLGVCAALVSMTAEMADLCAGLRGIDPDAFLADLRQRVEAYVARREAR